MMRTARTLAIAIAAVVVLPTLARADCAPGFTAAFDQQGNETCVSAGAVRTETHQKKVRTRDDNLRMQQQMELLHQRQPMMKLEQEQRTYRDELRQQQRERQQQLQLQRRIEEQQRP